ncbi:MAG: YtxH domain-containing protein [Bacteroidetes bacterium]|nr:YtxH domain-containing protein [Bacteroidota bacterium]
MRILKFMAIGAAVGYGIYYLTKEKENGKSILEELLEDAPDYADRAKKYVEYTLDQIAERFQV